MIHDSSRSSQDDIPELTRRQQLNDPLLKVRYSNIVSWRDDACLVDAIAKLSAVGNEAREVDVCTGH